MINTNMDDLLLVQSTYNPLMHSIIDTIISVYNKCWTNIDNISYLDMIHDAIKLSYEKGDMVY